MALAQRLRQLAPQAAPGLDDGALDELLTRALTQVRTARPQVQLDDESFLAGLARQLAPAPPVPALAALHLGDLFLALACLKGDRADLAALETELLSRVPRWIARLSGVNADDVQQELRQRLLLGEEPLLARYNAQRPLEPWLRVVATRLAIDLQRQQKPNDSSGFDDLWSGPDPELDAVKLHDAAALRALLQEAMQTGSSQERRLLRLHYLEGISLERLAIMEQVHRATVARWLSDARAGVLERVRALLAQRLSLTEAEGESLLRFVRSRLELSFRRALERSRPVTPA